MHPLAWLLVPLIFCLACASANAASRDGLLLEYHFDGNLDDSSGGGQTGTLAGALQYREGKEGQALAFDGASYFDSGLLLPELATFTLEGWVKPAEKQVDWANIFGNHAGGGVSGLVVQQYADKTNAFTYVFGSTTGRYYESGPVQFAAGKWQHVALVKDATELRGYLNGVLVVAMPAEGSMAVSDTTFRVGLGFPYPTRCFTGLVDEVRLWDKALSTFDVALSESEQMALFASFAADHTCLKVTWPGETGLLTTDGPREFTLSADERFLPSAIDKVLVTFEARHYTGTLLEALPSVTLERSKAFSAPVVLPARAGLYCLTAMPLAQAGQESVKLGSFAFTCLVQNPASAAREAVPTPITAKSLDGEDWLLATDPDNLGKQGNWQLAPRPEAVRAMVPWIIQDPFPGYHGLAWYWRSFTAPANPYEGGRTLLRFGQVDYLAEVWLNGTPIGGHEGGETPFELDITDTLKPGQENLLAVRVLNPTHDRIDDMVLAETPHRCKNMPYNAGGAYNHGGITGSVELALAPPVRIADLYVRAYADSGKVRVRFVARNTQSKPVPASFILIVAPDAAPSGLPCQPTTLAKTLAPGDNEVEVWLDVDSPHLWELASPFLYRVTARMDCDGFGDTASTRCGFRDFRFEEGYFRLNGKRLFLKSAHTVNHFPVGLQFPYKADYDRMDLVNAKAMGFNMVRFICGGATPEQLDLCDELGLMVYEESYASWIPMVDTPKLGERYDRSVSELIVRDRNHPSVVLWGLLNEVNDGPLFRHAVATLPLVRYLDDSRLVMLNSGRWDAQTDIGSCANPDSLVWAPSLGLEGLDQPVKSLIPPAGSLGYYYKAGDAHIYLKVPQTAESTAFLRTVGHDTQHVFLSEYGIGSAVDLWRVVRHFEQLGRTDVEDAQFYRARLDQFLFDWDRWQLGECFNAPESFFEASLARMASQRTLGLNAIRSNPNLVGHNVTGMIDHVMSGEGLTNAFREHKPGTIDAMFEAWAPLRLCLFAEPVNLYPGDTVELEAVVANEDALKPGDYPVRLLVIAPDGSKALDKTVTLTILEPIDGVELPFALPLFKESLKLAGPSGKWLFRASFQQGAAASGGVTEFYVTDRATLPKEDMQVMLFGDDQGLASWLVDHSIATQPWAAGELPAGSVILVGQAVPADHEAAFSELKRQVEAGARVIFLCPAVFADGSDPNRWQQLFAPGSQFSLGSWLYLMDAWGKHHPLFEGLQTGGLLDYTYYRELIHDTVFDFATPPREAVVGGINAALNYGSGLLLSVHDTGTGKALLTTLLVREYLGVHPAADRLLLNMIEYLSAP